VEGRSLRAAAEFTPSEVEGALVETTGIAYAIALSETG
jgi:hypothetical protein